PIVFLADPAGVFDHPIRVHIDRSGKDARGYMAIHADGPAFHAPALAHSGEWARREQVERQFQAAESHRLHYVAATRAGAMLVITQREKRSEANPWQFFQKWLEGRPRLLDPGPQVPPVENVPTINLAEAEAARVTSEARWARCRRETYAVSAAKKLSVPGQLRPSTGEHGTEWGTVIHLLLETAMRDSNANLRELAYTSLRELGSDLAEH